MENLQKHYCEFKINSHLLKYETSTTQAMIPNFSNFRWWLIVLLWITLFSHYDITLHSRFLTVRGFLPEFPQTCPKSDVQLFLQIFSHIHHEDLFWCGLQKRYFFLQRLGAIIAWILPRYFGILQGVCPSFQGFCPDFRHIKTFRGALAPTSPAPRAPKF